MREQEARRLKATTDYYYYWGHLRLLKLLLVVRGFPELRALMVAQRLLTTIDVCTIVLPKSATRVCDAYICVGQCLTDLMTQPIANMAVCAHTHSSPNSNQPYVRMHERVYDVHVCVCGCV